MPATLEFSQLVAIDTHCCFFWLLIIMLSRLLEIWVHLFSDSYQDVKVFYSNLQHLPAWVILPVCIKHSCKFTEYLQGKMPTGNSTTDTQDETIYRLHQVMFPNMLIIYIDNH